MSDRTGLRQALAGFGQHGLRAVGADGVRRGKALYQQLGGIPRPAAQVDDVPRRVQRHAGQQFGHGAGALVLEAGVQRGVPVAHWVLAAKRSTWPSTWRAKRTRSALHADVAKRGELSLSPFAEMSWQDFERVTAEYFRQQGFAVAETSGSGADGGGDIVLARGADRYLVQCKQWRALRVGVEPVRELYGLIHACRAAGGFVVTSGTFTTDAKRFAEGREIALIDGMQLAKAIRQQALRPHIERLSPAPRESAGATPVCPQCKSPMQLRKARRGSGAGKEFWGCSRYPACRATRPV